MKTGYIFLIGIAFILSCNPQEKSKDFSYHIQIADSVQIDYLGVLKLKDYDRTEDRYLLSDGGIVNVIEVGNNGEILSRLKLSEDGPNAISNQVGLGYLDGQTTVYAMERGFIQLNGDGQITREIKIPYPHSYLFFLPYLPIFSTTDGFIYIKPLGKDEMQGNFGEDFYKKYYSMDILEKLDSATNTTTTLMGMPPDATFADGNNHGIYVPIVRKNKDKWFLSLWLENQVYVFKETIEGMEYDTTLKIPVDDMVNYKSVSMKDSEHFFEVNSGIRAGHTSDILFVGDLIVAVYRKGLDANRMQDYDPQNNPLDRIKIEKEDGFYAAIFDSAYNLLAKDVQFPSGIDYPGIVNQSNQIVAMKKVEQFDQEDEFITLYQLDIQKQEISE